MSTAHKPQSILLFVAFIVFIDMMGIGLILPVMPSLIENITGATVDRAAEIGGWLLFAYAMMQFLFAPIIGGLSDRFGRRPVLLITLFLLGVDYAIMAWAPTLIWLFIGRILSGIMGTSWAAANSCVADVTTPEDRGKYFGILGGAGAMGFVLGPAIGGILGEYGDRLPFIAASVLALIGTAIGIFGFERNLAVGKTANLFNHPCQSDGQHHPDVEDTAGARLPLHHLHPATRRPGAGCGLGLLADRKV